MRILWRQLRTWCINWWLKIDRYVRNRKLNGGIQVEYMKMRPQLIWHFCTNFRKNEIESWKGRCDNAKAKWFYSLMLVFHYDLLIYESVNHIKTMREIGEKFEQSNSILIRNKQKKNIGFHSIINSFSWVFKCGLMVLYSNFMTIKSGKTVQGFFQHESTAKLFLDYI